MSPDPHGGGIGNPQSLNLYAYGLNSPLSVVDPSGMDPIDINFIWLASHSTGGGGVVVVGGPFGGGGAFGGAGFGNLGLCFALNCGFGGGGFASALPGPPSSGQLASESNLGNIATGVGKGLFNTILSFLGQAAPGADRAFDKVGIRELEASNSTQTWAMRGTFAATIFIPGSGEEEAIGATGRIGESALKRLGGEAQVYFRTSKGGRFIDSLVGRVGHESKVGYTRLSWGIRRQIAKDAELLTNGRLEGVIWHFFQSPVTGRIGPTQSLLEELLRVGIGIVIH